MQHTRWLETIRQDLRYGARQLLKNPAFTAVAVLTLGLGIGANSAMFSVLYSVLLHPLPYANADRILTLRERNGQDAMVVTYGNFDVWKREASGFEALGAVASWGPATLTGYGDPAPIAQQRVSAGYWKALYVPPALGRYFGEDEDRFGAAPVVVVSHALWQNRLGGRPDIIGQSITLSGRPFTVVAVASPDHITDPPAERIWAPLAPSPERVNDHADHELSIYGLVKREITAANAVAQLTQVETALAKEYPNSFFDGGILAKPLIDSMVGSTRLLLYVLFGAVGVVLLIACGNVANLLLARATARRAEIAIRGALGASRSRILSQLLVESLLLALAGAAAGVVVAMAGIRFLVHSPVPVPRLQNAGLNPTVLAFTLALSAACAVVFGLLPALRAAGWDLQQTLRDGGRESRGATRERVRAVLIVGELCLAQVLLIGAGLLIRSAELVNAVPPGFDPHNLLAFGVSLWSARYPKPAQMEAGFNQIENAIEAIPGVSGVARTQAAPIYSGGWNWTTFREGSDGHDDGAVVTDMRSASAKYFQTLRIPLLRGRYFTDSDGPDAPRVVIISRALAKRLYGDADPLGRRIGDASTKNTNWREIVGVVDDIRSNGQAEDAPLVVYRPSAQWINGGQTLLVRGAVPVTRLLPAIRRAVAGVDPLLAISNVATMEEAMDRKQAVPRFTSWLLTLLGAAGLVIALVGVYGVIGYFVTQRTHEFGVRMALGASSSAVQWMVVRRALVLGVIGMIIGMVLSLYAARLLRTMLFGVTAHDPVTFALVALLLLAVGTAASYVPSRRATRIDPLEALRGG
jgi:putative ABC transport system permease protein